jgi:hypothetical protein
MGEEYPTPNIAATLQPFGVERYLNQENKLKGM